jgi:hypothetical protein
MTMHLDNRLSTISTKKRDVKMTKAKLADYEVRWRKHNKWAKQNNMHDMRYATIEQYIDYCHGKTPKRDVRRDRSVLQQERVPQRVTTEYPSAPMSTKGNTTKKEPLRYTGERKLLGIATMHKSNAVPIFEDDKQHAIDIARMRR